MNKTTTQSSCLATLMLLAAANGALAQRLTIDNFEISAGQTKELSLKLNSEGKTVKGFQADFQLPNGISLAGDPVAVSGIMADGSDAMLTFRNNRIMLFSMTGQVFKPSTTVAKLKVTASANFSNVNGTWVAITTKNTKFTLDGGTETSASREVSANAVAEYYTYTSLPIAFSFSGDAVGKGIRTYAKDVQAGEVSGLLGVYQWKYTAGQLTNGDAHAAGVFPAGSTAFLGKEGVTPPSTAVNLLGLQAVWDATTQYTQKLILPAGDYVMRVPVYCTSYASDVAKNLFGFVEDNGTEHFYTRSYFNSGWQDMTIAFSLAAETKGYVSLGYKAPQSASIDDMPALFVGNVTISRQVVPTPPVPEEPPVLTSGTYYLRNIATGLYWGSGNNWGTRASLVEHPEAIIIDYYVGEGSTPDEQLYTFESEVSNGGANHYFNGDFMDNNAAQHMRIVNHGDFYTVESVDGFFGYDGATTVLGKGLADGDDNAKWEIVNIDNPSAPLYGAGLYAPADATYLIKDANFGRNNRYGTWRNDEGRQVSGDKGSKWVVSADCTNYQLSGGTDENRCAESYHSTFTVSQTLSVPNGIYKVMAQGFYRQDGDDNSHLPYLIAGDEVSLFPLKTGAENSMADASNAFAAGLYNFEPIVLRVTNGQLRVGVRLEDNKNLWCIWDNFSLYYYGDNCEVIDVVLFDEDQTFRQLANEARSILSSTDIEAVHNLLGWVIDYEPRQMLDPTKESYREKIEELRQQIAQAKHIINPDEPIDEPTEVTLEEGYANAMETLKNSTYRIFTTTADGAKLYLNAQGYLVGQEEAAAFNIASVTAEGTLYETGWNLGCRFTNPGLTNGSTGTIVNTGHINVGGNNRNDWERQVFFLNNDGMYAVRATNANSANWGANSYWNVFDGAELPEAGYSLEPAYVWQLEDVAAEMAKNNLVADIDKLLAFIADNADAYTIDAEALEEDIAALNALKEADYETADAVAAAQDAVAAAMLDFFGEITPKANIDVTDLFIENATAVASRALPSGWEGDTFGDSSDGVSEYWNMAAASFAQTVLLPAGNYMLTAEALTRTDMTATLAAGEASMAIATVGSDVVNSRAQAAAWFDEGNGKNQLPFAVAEAAPVAISLTADAETSDYWMVWRSFKLELMADGQQPEPVAGDITGTGEVDEDDVDLFIEQLLGGQLPTDATSDDFARYDVNGDGVVNIADAQAILNLSVGLNWDGSEPDEETAEVRALTPEALSATLTAQSMTMADGITRYVVRLSGNVRYTGFQMEVVGDVVAERGALPTGPSGAALELRSRTTGGTHRIAALGDEMAAGEVLTIDVKGQARFTDICFTTAQAQALYLNIDGATAIDGIAAAGIQGAKVYGIGGEQHSATQRGINIVRQADGNVKKVIVK